MGDGFELAAMLTDESEFRGKGATNKEKKFVRAQQYVSVWNLADTPSGSVDVT